MPVVKFDLPKPNSPLIVTVELTGPTGSINVRLILDTGATHTFVRPGFFQAIGYKPFRAPKESVITGSGRADIWPVDVSQLTVFTFPIRRFKLYAQQFPPNLLIDGVLGLNVFRKLKKTLRIDFLNRELELS